MSFSTLYISCLLIIVQARSMSLRIWVKVVTISGWSYLWVLRVFMFVSEPVQCFLPEQKAVLCGACTPSDNQSSLSAV